MVRDAYLGAKWWMMSYAERGLFSAKLWMKCRNAKKEVCLACGRYRSDEGAAVWPQMRFTLCFFIFNLNSNFQSSGSRFTKTDDKSVNHDCLLKNGCWDFDFRIENSTSLLSFVCCILKLNTQISTMSRPKISLHLVVTNPGIGWQIKVCPEYGWQKVNFAYRRKRKRALLRSNLPGNKPVCYEYHRT